MTRIVLSAWLVLMTACGEPLECTTDQACGDDAYCLETKCRPIELTGQFRDSFREQILPLIKAECNCHGSQADRPWFFDSRPGFVEGNRNFRRVEPWIRHYNSPKSKEELAAAGGAEDLAAAPIPLNRYAAGQCGFNHPGVYDPTGPKARLMELWARDAAKESLEQLPLPEGTPVDLASTPPRVTRRCNERTGLCEGGPGDCRDVECPAGERCGDSDVCEAAATGCRESGCPGTFYESLPTFERNAFDRASRIAEVDSYAAAMDAEIVPRVLGQCGCCHDQSGFFDIGFEPPTDMGPGPDPSAPNRGLAGNFLGQKTSVPEFVGVVKYGLGSCLNDACTSPHPKIYTGPDDPRLQLFRAWILEGPDPNAVVEPDPDMGPPTPIGDGGVPEAGPPEDMGPPPDPTAFIDTYVETIAPHFSAIGTGCAGGNCHSSASGNRWFHRTVNGPDDMENINANLAELAQVLPAEQEDPNGRTRVIPGDGENSPIVAFGDGIPPPAGQTPHPFPIYSANDPNRAAVVAWINALPATFPVPASPPDAAPPPMPMDAAPIPMPMDAAAPADMALGFDAGIAPDGDRAPEKP